MGIENERKKDKKETKLSRREVIAGAALYGATAGPAAVVGAKLLHDDMKYMESLRHKGVATVVEKIEKKGVPMSGGKIASEFLTDLAIAKEGILGAALDAAQTANQRAESAYFIRIKIGDLPPFVAPIDKTQFAAVNIGMSLDVEYTTSHDGKKIEAVDYLKVPN